MRMKSLAVLVMPLALIACSKSNKGGASNGLAGGMGNIIEGQFIDAPVKGLSFVTSSSTGKTGDHGKFSCKRGESVEFKLGALSLGQAACGDKIFVQDLDSSDVNHTWEKAASLLQTFSVPQDGGALLDLSEVDLSAAAIPASFPVTLDGAALASYLIGAVHPVGHTPVNVLPAAASTVANTALATHATVSSELAALFTAFGSNRTIYGKKIAGSNECWQGIVAKSSIVETAGVFKFSINSAFSYDSSEYAEGDVCTTENEEAYECHNASSSILPTNKIVSGSNITTMVKPQSYGGTTGNPGAISLTASLVGTEFTVGGTFKESFNYNGQVHECYYDLSLEKPDLQDPGSSDDDGPGDASGSWSGQVTCEPVPDASEYFTVSFSIVADASTPHGYKAINMSILDDEDVPVPVQATIDLTNDENTPDDVPFLDHSQEFEGNVWNLGGYHNWGNGASTTFHFFINGDGQSCTGDLSKN